MKTKHLGAASTTDQLGKNVQILNVFQFDTNERGRTMALCKKPNAWVVMVDGKAVVNQECNDSLKQDLMIAFPIPVQDEHDVPATVQARWDKAKKEWSCRFNVNEVDVPACVSSKKKNFIAVYRPEVVDASLYQGATDHRLSKVDARQNKLVAIFQFMTLGYHRTVAVAHRNCLWTIFLDGKMLLTLKHGISRKDRHFEQTFDVSFKEEGVEKQLKARLEMVWLVLKSMWKYNLFVDGHEIQTCFTLKGIQLLTAHPVELVGSRPPKTQTRTSSPKSTQQDALPLEDFGVSPTLALEPSPSSMASLCGFFAYDIGEQVEYFSVSHSLWLHGTIVKRYHVTSTDEAYDVQVGSRRQLRSMVRLDSLRHGLQANECIEFFDHYDTEWKAGEIYGPQIGVSRLGYKILLRGETEPRERIHPHTVRRRFPAGAAVNVYWGPELGWKLSSVTEDQTLDGVGAVELATIRVSANLSNASSDRSLSMSKFLKDEGSHQIPIWTVVTVLKADAQGKEREDYQDVESFAVRVLADYREPVFEPAASVLLSENSSTKAIS